MLVARVSHQSPQRVRLRLDAKKGDAGFFEKIRKALAQCPGVESVQTNPLTGSVLIRHHCLFPDLVEHARKHRLFAIQAFKRGHQDNHRCGVTARIGGQMGGIDDRLRRISRGEVDLESVVFLGLVGIGIYQLWKRRLFPPALTALWNAYNLLEAARSKR